MNADTVDGVAFVLEIVITLLFAVMAFRAIRSGSTTDYGLAATQCVGLVLLWSAFHDVARYLLLLTAAAYLASQILTGARVISRVLPLAGAVAIVLSLFV